MKTSSFRYTPLLGLLMILVLGIAVVYAAITFDDDDSSSWYGPHEPNGLTDPIATAILDGDFTPGACPPPPPPKPPDPNAPPPPFPPPYHGGGGNVVGGGSY